ncbi:hypothetical protein ACFZ8E_13095 [Methylobacterium sp. HMF5984]|uniref:hypothetical protein n=1 Tax=Methylobacterium sp. HMF5984 TaxID=3367370 RepID=UPI0038536080
MNSILQMRLVVRAGKSTTSCPARQFLTLSIQLGLSMSEIAKPKVGRPRVDAIPITVRAPPALVTPLDAWIADQPEPKPSRPEAIRHALTDWLTGQGYVRHREDPEGAN